MTLFLMCGLYAVSLKQSIDGGLLATEALVERHRVLGATLRQDVVSEALGCRLVEDAVLLEQTEGIGIEHLCPLVAVIACGVASCHDVAKLHRHAGVLELWHDHGLLPRLLLKRYDVVGERLLLGVVGHVEQSEAHLSQTAVGSHEVAALHDAVYQLVGKGLACLVVEGEGAKKLFLHSVVFHKL